ncbi:MAG TPA: hypothetical protein EYP25_03375, partial [Anaerolineae bacterium]|nr:hypothetical protein [Anaerolineae bacterium]
MKTFLALFILLLVTPWWLTGCSQGLMGNPELEVTPALTPILMENAPSHAGTATADPTMPTPGLAIASGRATGKRTPIVIQVPRTAMEAAATPRPPAVASPPRAPE